MAEGEAFLKRLEGFHSKIDFASKLLLQAKIYQHLIGDDKRVVEIYEFILKKYPDFLEGYHSYWRYLVKMRKHTTDQL
jgi:hypothetical protein